ncbi:hypothetical protein ILYODFUR_018560 [Ilyodon furcidens]|uniref:Uncharacterized protein n=1 Tax=Ilyodon furcidens TaxID=33524 RepID=A0ABV0T9B8_9TELE
MKSSEEGNFCLFQLELTSLADYYFILEVWTHMQSYKDRSSPPQIASSHLLSGCSPSPELWSKLPEF